MSHLVTGVYKFFKKDLWLINLQKQSRIKKGILNQFRIVIYAVKDFFGNNCPLHASALTYYSLLTIVPAFALLFGMSKGFGLQKTLTERVLIEFPEHAAIIQWVIKFADALLAVSRSGLITGLGILLLLWTVLKVLGNIEESLNTIWKISRSRSFIRKFSDYLSIMILGPVLFLVSGSIAVFITAQVTDFTQNNSTFNALNPVVMIFLKLVPYALIWILFTLTYMIIPNTKVQLKAALYGAVIAGTIFQLVQWVYIDLQVGVSRYNAIYGSFAALPLFLFWLQLSWFIVLLGAELSYAFQNIPLYLFEKKASYYSDFYKKVLMLNIVYTIIKNFEKRDPAMSEKQIADQTEISENMAKEFLLLLVKAGIISQIVKNKRYYAYQPSKDINKITIQDVLSSLEKSGSIKTFDKAQTIPKKLMRILEGFNKDIFKNPQNILIKNL